jgi:indolepyruvate ferredoxin oxidoreductase beta subunit
VFSLSPVPGALDALVSSELLETARQVGNGMARRLRTLVISSTARLLHHRRAHAARRRPRRRQRLLEAGEGLQPRAPRVRHERHCADTGTVVSA